ncbi:MAG: GIY-YIG nuclease family protein [Rikenellaceae bacterium]|nr:GIY-YIG nuclease family protein [Rikenellaceae bacterium]
MRRYWVYMLTNSNRSVLYIGVTDSLDRRLSEHRQGEGSAFTARYRVTHLVYYEVYTDIRDAIAREKELKGWRRSKKEALIAQTNPLWLFLGEEE